MTVEAPARWEVTDDVDVFTDMLHNCYLPFAMTGADGNLELFSATVREQPLGQLRLVDGLASPHRGVRGPRQVGVTSRDVVGLQCVLAGRELIYGNDDVIPMGPGDLMVWDSDVVGGYELIEAVRKRTLVLPRSLADALLPELHTPGTVRVISGERAHFVRPLFELLAVLSKTLPTMSPHASDKAAALVIQMLADLGGRGTRRIILGRRSATNLSERVLEYVENNLGDSALRPATVAAAHFVSTRTLYSAFELRDMSLSAYIRTRRLARCYADLISTDDPVGDIASRWGFVSLPHFSRAFVKQYGFAPSRARRSA
ncbi:helix-turn-helix domain-containing protein [Mycobacterium sp. Aquia_216]|uniref:helix-turn-helix domain-containing protein n=1 Tax=Mycobacterium sp. Aquia_216 TaxID=2991729 RepID=UPI00227C9C54|nr:helix-turn-helix domain-containing protein [Mycobacterium sp. Aquia_216]WAJ47413.1 helix-turn-helix domain-containing protein [Mycobacterium sp. Aquia_216]